MRSFGVKALFIRLFLASFVIGGTVRAVDFTLPAGSERPLRDNRWAIGRDQDRQAGGHNVMHQGDSLENSRVNLDTQARLELMETFGEEFRARVEEEDKIIRGAFEGRARAGKEAGCVPSSPLYSPSRIAIRPAPGDEGRGGTYWDL